MKKRCFFISDINSLRNLRYILKCDIPAVRYVPAVHEKELEFMKILLASKSPRRRELLLGMGLKFDICSPQFDEDSVSGFSPEVTVEKLSLGKALSAAENSDAIVIGSDTVVALDNVILGKPADEADAVRMLQMLSDRTHFVYTGVAIVGNGKSIVTHEKTAVHFRKLTDEDIKNYVACGEPMDKAGAYGIQGKGAMLVSGIEGDYFTVVGFPVCRVSEILKNEFGIDCLKGKL